jgi:hypothetical protein
LRWEIEYDTTEKWCSLTTQSASLCWITTLKALAQQHVGNGYQKRRLLMKTLQELRPKAGDVVEYCLSQSGEPIRHTISQEHVAANYEMFDADRPCWVLAVPTAKRWRELSEDQLAGLLLADFKGRPIEVSVDGYTWTPFLEEEWEDDLFYREVVTTKAEEHEVEVTVGKKHLSLSFKLLDGHVIEPSVKLKEVA